VENNHEGSNYASGAETHIVMIQRTDSIAKFFNVLANVTHAGITHPNMKLVS
jgi:hypothetical protein